MVKSLRYDQKACDKFSNGADAGRLRRTGHADADTRAYGHAASDCDTAPDGHAYWFEGTKHLADDPGLDGVYFTNFSCGPDRATADVPACRTGGRSTIVASGAPAQRATTAARRKLGRQLLA